MTKRRRLLRWPTTHEQSEYMRQNQLEQIARAKANPNEAWMLNKLKQTPYKWSRQSRWGYRIFDFWCHVLGIAIEVDGPEHRSDYDSYRDRANYVTSGILVLRVRNRNEDDAAQVIQAILNSETWNERRQALGLKPVRCADNVAQDEKPLSN